MLAVHTLGLWDVVVEYLRSKEVSRPRRKKVIKRITDSLGS